MDLSRKDIWIILLGSVSGYFITQFFDQVKNLLLNIFSSQNIPFNELKAFAGLFSILITTVVVVHLIIRFKNYASKKQRSLTVEDYLDDLIKKLRNFKHRWNWGIPFWSQGYKRQISSRVISFKKIRNHSTEIRIAIKSLKEHLPKTNTKILTVLESLDAVIDRMVDFSSELEETFEILNVNDIPKIRLKELVSEGEDVRKRISQHLDSLDKLRGTISDQSHNSSTVKEAVVPENSFIEIVTPPEIEIGSFANISVTFQGSLKDGCLTCRIVDFYDKENWSVDRTTVDYLSDGRELGKLNFRNEKRIYNWLISPEKYLAKGRGRLEICAYEIRDYLKNGQIVKDRRLIAWAKKEVLLN